MEFSLFGISYVSSQFIALDFRYLCQQNVEYRHRMFFFLIFRPEQISAASLETQSTSCVLDGWSWAPFTRIPGITMGQETGWAPSLFALMEVFYFPYFPLFPTFFVFPSYAVFRQTQQIYKKKISIFHVFQFYLSTSTLQH